MFSKNIEKFIRKTFFWAIKGVLCLFLITCQSEKKGEKTKIRQTLRLAFYNPENLFDIYDNPAVEDNDFLPEGINKWTKERYEKKIENLAQLVDSLDATILGLCEVENTDVLENLLQKEALKDKKYRIVHFDSPHRKGLDVALFYKKDFFEPILTKNFAINLAAEPSFKTQDILLVSGKIFSQDELHILVVHLSEENQAYRLAVARQSRVIVDEILRQKPHAQVVVMGDFNELPTDSSLVEGIKANVKPDFEKKELFNPFYRIMEKGEGSFYQKGNWNMFDQIVFSKGLLETSSWHYIDKSASIFSPPYAKTKQKPLPTFGENKYWAGYSDHFPVFIDIFRELEKP